MPNTGGCAGSYIYKKLSQGQEKKMFWLLGFILPFAAVAAPPCQGGSPTYQRKEFRELIDPSDSSRLLPEGQAYIDGCLCLMNAPGSSAPDASIWVYQSYNIQDDFSKAHFDAMFPYHGKSSVNLRHW